MPPEENTQQRDPIAAALSRYAQNILVVIFGFIPLFFIPTVAAPFDYTKVSIVVAGIFIALVLYSLSVLRSGQITLRTSYALYALWAVVVIAGISSFLSGDFKDSFVGDLFSIHSTVFLAVLALIPTVWMLLKVNKVVIMRLYILLSVSTILLVVFHACRLILGPSFLSLNVLTATTSTPVGSWNDLALFLGLTIILSLVALEQLLLTKIGRILFTFVTVVSLLMLGVINFFTVWLILGLTSLAMVVYTLGKDRFTRTQPTLMSTQTPQTTSLLVALVVLAISVFFIIGGATLGGWISKYTGVSYIEVRPSLIATGDIARNVYKENAFLGIGTNKFTDAWRLYKDPSINVTPFWNTDFNAGNGYITTFFVTTGVFGGVAWLTFLVLFLVTGVRRLINVAANSDRIWYFIALSSFVSAIYIWGMSIIYVPGVVILLLGALCTGLSLGALNTLSESEGRTITIANNRKTGFLLTLAVIVVIIGSVSVLYVAGRHYASVYTFNENTIAMQRGVAVADLEKQVESAYQLSSSDVFARRIAEYQLARMNALIGLPAPTADEQQQFQNASVVGVNAAQQAIQIDASEPANWAVLGGIYGLLASARIEGAQERAVEAMIKSRDLNSKNPVPYLELALVEARAGNYDQARSYIGDAITLKQNFTEAFYLLSQLEIATGNVDAAVKSTLAIINLEPQNPARYYQLGVLESSRSNLTAAVPAFEKAVAFDYNFANARYLLALAYDELGRSGDAKAQLEAVLALNPGNAEIATLLKVISDTGSLKSLRANAQQTVSEPESVTDNNGTVSTTGDTDTPLVSTVNTAPKLEGETSSGAQ